MNNSINPESKELGATTRQLAIAHAAQGISIADAAANWQREMLIAYLAQYAGNQLRAAAAMGVHRNTVSRLMRHAGITIRVRVYGRKRSRVISDDTGRWADVLVMKPLKGRTNVA